MSNLTASPPEDRGGIFSGDLTEEGVVSISHAFIHYLHDVSTSSLSNRIAIGFDGRERSRDFASHSAEIISRSGIEVLLSSGIVPVAATSFATRYYRCMGGIMITGGSAPPDKVGIEFKGCDGAPLPAKEVGKIGSLLSESARRPADSNAPPGAISVIEFLPAYQSYLRTIIDLSALTSFAQNPKNNANVLIDSMGGAGQTIMEEILVSCGWRAQTLFGAPEARYFDRCPKPIPENLQALKYNVTVVDAQMGIATDGDAGMCGVILDNGDCLDVQNMTLVLLWHLLEQKRWSGNFLKPPFITDRVGRISDRGGMSVIETDLEGDFGESAKNDWILGVSEKGEMSFGTCLPERDGILVGLLFAEMTAISGNGLRQIVELVENRSGRGFYKSIDIMGGSPENPNLLSKLRSSISSIYPGEVPVSLQLYEHAGQVRGIKIRWGFCRWLFAELIAGGSAIRIHVEANTNEELRSTLGQATSVLNTLISHHPQL